MSSSSSSSQLADVFIQFSAQGADVVKQAIKEIREESDTFLNRLAKVPGLTVEMAKEAIKAEEASQKQAERTKDAYQSLAGMARMAFATATASTLGWVTAGMSGTMQAQMLGFQMGELSRTIAGIFQPEIQGMIDAVREVTSWMRSLSDETLANIARWAKFAFAFGTVLVLAPKVISAIGAITTAIRAFGITTLFAQAAAGNWATVIGAIAVATAAGIAFSSIGGGGGSRRSLGASVGGLEDVQAAYGRAAQRSVSAGTSIPEQQLEEAKKQTTELEKLNGTVKDKPPVIDKRR